MNKIIRLVLLSIIIYYFGYYLSKLIDYLFSPCDIYKHHYTLMFDIVSEFVIAFIIYIIINKYIYKKYSGILYKLIPLSNKNIVQSILTTAFSYGIYKNLDTCFENIRFLRNKFINNEITL